MSPKSCPENHLHQADSGRGPRAAKLFAEGPRLVARRDSSWWRTSWEFSYHLENAHRKSQLRLACIRVLPGFFPMLPLAMPPTAGSQAAGQAEQGVSDGAGMILLPSWDGAEF